MRYSLRSSPRPGKRYDVGYGESYDVRYSGDSDVVFELAEVGALRRTNRNLCKRSRRSQKSDIRGQNAEVGIDREVSLSYIVLHMKSSTLTIRLDPDLDRLLTKASRRSGRNRSQVAREALRRQLRISQFERLRQRVMPFAEARGYLTDEDVFADVS